MCSSSMLIPLSSLEPYPLTTSQQMSFNICLILLYYYQLYSIPFYEYFACSPGFHQLVALIFQTHQPRHLAWDSVSVVCLNDGDALAYLKRKGCWLWRKRKRKPSPVSGICKFWIGFFRPFRGGWTVCLLCCRCGRVNILIKRWENSVRKCFKLFVLNAGCFQQFYDVSSCLYRFYAVSKVL